MKLFEAVKTIRDYCSNTMCGDCPFAVLYKIDRYNGKIWRCELAGTPYEWKVPTETNIYDSEEVHENCTVQILKNSVTGETSVGWWENGN